MFKKYKENLIYYICVVLLFLTLGGTFNIFGVILSVGESMKSNPIEKENTISVVMNYKFIGNNVKRFDTVTVDDVDESMPLYRGYYKRIIGLPGEHIYCDGGEVWINGEKLIEPHAYINGRDSYAPFECTLKEGEYFVLGDNRCNSCDSRSFGPIKFSDIRAKVIYEFFF